jgi:hypothetical protein
MQPIARKALNQKQLLILHILYKFRFGTEALLTKHQATITQRYMHERLRILCEQQYIGRTYNGSFKLAGKPAYYYLLPKGIAILKQRPDDFDYQVLRNIRKDAKASDRFVEHSLNVLETCIAMKTKYGEGLKFFTGSYIHQYDYFPMPLPDAYATIQVADKQTTRHIIIECFDTTKPDFVIRKRIEQLIDHADSGEWPADKYPELLFICNTVVLKKKVEKWAAKSLEASWLEDLIVTVKLTSELDCL